LDGGLLAIAAVTMAITIVAVAFAWAHSWLVNTTT
jgi:hypothetical protein